MLKILIVSFFIFLIIVAFFLIRGKGYLKTQEEYFSKVEYDICGRMISYRLLGGAIYLIEIKVDSFNMTKNQLKKNDNIVGLYSSKNDIAYILAYFDVGDEESYDKISSGRMPYIVINSYQKTIEYRNDTNSVIKSLRSFDIYKSDLLENETNEMIKF